MLDWWLGPQDRLLAHRLSHVDEGSAGKGRDETNVDALQENREHHGHSCTVGTTAGELSLWKLDPAQVPDV